MCKIASLWKNGKESLNSDGQELHRYQQHNQPSLTSHHWIRVITKLPNSKQSYKGKVKTQKYINRQNQSTTRKLRKP